MRVAAPLFVSHQDFIKESLSEFCLRSDFAADPAVAGSTEDPLLCEREGSTYMWVRGRGYWVRGRISPRATHSLASHPYPPASYPHHIGTRHSTQRKGSTLLTEVGPSMPLISSEPDPRQTQRVIHLMIFGDTTGTNGAATLTG